MVWVMLVVAVVVAALTVAAVAGRVDGSMGEPTSTLSHVPLPPEQVTESALGALRFDTGLRGYRMSQVDDVIDRLRRELADRDDQLAVLRAVVTPPDTSPPEPAQPPAVAGPAASLRASMPIEAD
ncbi:MAG TPA: DivIVA domain-containing protein [Candidatus Lustribacter sp.]|nr:DivIVA domain-containing protein [Candidatus Lustribacter sp.]